MGRSLELRAERGLDTIMNTGGRKWIRVGLTLNSEVTSKRTTRYRTGETGLNFHPKFLYESCRQ